MSEKLTITGIVEEPKGYSCQGPSDENPILNNTGSANFTTIYVEMLSAKIRLRACTDFDQESELCARVQPPTKCTKGVNCYSWVDARRIEVGDIIKSE